MGGRRGRQRKPGKGEEEDKVIRGETLPCFHLKVGAGWGGGEEKCLLPQLYLLLLAQGGRCRVWVYGVCACVL